IFFYVKFSFHAEFRARSADAFRCSRGRRPRLVQPRIAPSRRLIEQIAISRSRGGGQAFRRHPSHPRNPTITPTVSINPCANTGAQRFRPVSKYADPRMKPATLESRIPVGPL